MAEKSKLFDYNTSFLVTRTNPLLTGNVKITIDSSGGVSLNSINANEALSTERFKNYKISGKNSYATDIYNFLDEGNVDSEILFDISKKTNGDIESSNNFELQYDFFYGAGASTLIDTNYSEPFSYLAPLWLKTEIPEFFVIFKTPKPISYSYSENVEIGNIIHGKEYKIIQNPDEEPFSILYGLDSLGIPIKYSAGETFKGDNLVGQNYTIASGSGKVTLLEELKFQDKVNNVENYFNEKILSNSLVIETFDLREGTLIGDYIRAIVNNPAFSNGPIDLNFGDNSYSYYHGIDYKSGIYTKAGELLHDYLSSVESTPMIDFESHITKGFSRNNIISTNLINLEFAFDDKDSDLYTINRYFGMYVSRNDLGKFRLDGNSYFSERATEGNNNIPIPIRNNIGYYYNNTPYKVKSGSGIRLYYENGTGWIPGSDDTNINDSDKLYYITDKHNKFHSLKRTENYSSLDVDNIYGSKTESGFKTYGIPDSERGNLLISDSHVDLLDFTGISDFVASVPVKKLNNSGYAYTEIKFNRIYDLPKPIVFKLFWSGGTYKERDRRFDLIRSGDYSGLFEWIKGSFYNFGESKIFNPYSGTSEDIASSFSSLIRDFAGHRLDSANSASTSILRSNIPGYNLNEDFSISVFYDYANFENKYKGLLNPSTIYVEGDIVIDQSENYLEYLGGEWTKYNTFKNSKGYGSIKNVDFSEINSNIFFSGGTDYSGNRIEFSISDSSIIKVGNYIQSNKGYSKIGSIDRIVDYTTLDEKETVTRFNNYELSLVANLEDPQAIPKLDKDSKVSVFKQIVLSSGVFTFFDIKDFDFDFWTSDYSNTPSPELNRYYYLKADQENIIKDGIPYIVKDGSIKYNEILYNQGDAFEGIAGITSFKDMKKSGKDATVIPIPYSQIKYKGSNYNYGTSQNIKYESNLGSFNGFYGIEAINVENQPNEVDKRSLFNYGKLNSEYEYLKENYNINTSNISRIVPYINKWSLVKGTDGRGNPYRLNSSPAFSPTNFSPSIDREIADPLYLTHEGYILESLPRDYPVASVNLQNNYLPSPPDYSILRDANPVNKDYFDSKFTISSLEYPGIYSNDSGLTKEFFGAFDYNKASGYYEIVFRGIKYILKRKTNISNVEEGDPREFVTNYRGFDGYKFTSILRVESENESIQAPVKYEIIENTTQKSIIFLITVVIDDYRAKELSLDIDTVPILDYTLLYTLNDKKKLFLQTNGLELSKIDDIKLSVGMDLSYSSDSLVDSIISPGRIYSIENPEYDTDLREEISITYAEGSSNSYSSKGSFWAPNNGSIYPWPIGVSKSFIEFGKLTPEYSFDLPFLGITGGITIPVGSEAIYKNLPIYQLDGGEEYYSSIISRISMGQIARRINESNPYIKYITYSWDSEKLENIITENSFSLKIESPTHYQKPSGLFHKPSSAGPQTIGETQITSYDMEERESLKTELLRFGGFYEPIAKKVIMFKNDKSDSIFNDPRHDLSFRNATFASNKKGFGKLKNLNYSKISRDSDILSKSKELPEGPVYPLIYETPIDRKEFSLFLSSWDPGYYDEYTTTNKKNSVAGTRSMKEMKTFFGSKMMKTPDNIRINNFIGMEVSKTEGNSNINEINNIIRENISKIQNLNITQNASGIGQISKVFIGVDIDKMDEDIFPEAELIWQNIIDPFKEDVILSVKGIIRIDRMVKRYLLNSGVKKDFVEHILSEYGVGNPTNIDDDILEYLEYNVLPIFETTRIDFYIKKLGSEFDESNLTIRGDILPSYRARTGFIRDKNFSLTKREDLIFEFEYKLDDSKFTSINFSFDINKI